MANEVALVWLCICNFFFLWIKLVACLLRDSKVVFKNPDQDYIQELTFSKALESALCRRDINKSPIVRYWENNTPILPTCLNLSFLPCNYAVPSSHEWVLHVDCFGQCIANRSLEWACASGLVLLSSVISVRNLHWLARWPQKHETHVEQSQLTEAWVSCWTADN